MGSVGSRGPTGGAPGPAWRGLPGARVFAPKAKVSLLRAQGSAQQHQGPEHVTAWGGTAQLNPRLSAGRLPARRPSLESGLRSEPCKACCPPASPEWL